jgi:hypothetical protein
MPVSLADDTVSPVVWVSPAKVPLIVVEPALMGVTRPLEPKALLMVAMVLLEDLQVAWEVRSWENRFDELDASVKFPVAVNCSVAPRKIVALMGVILMDVRLAFVTVRVTGMVFVTVPNAAVMEVVPAPTDVASPLVVPELLMAATEVTDDFQTTDVVISWAVLSE